MSSNNRITQSKGEPEAASLPPRTRPCRKSTNTDNQPDRPTFSQSATGPTATNEDTHEEVRCQSTHPQDQPVRMWETPVPVLPMTPSRPRPLTPHIPLPKPQDFESLLSQMSAPLFVEDIYSTSSEFKAAACDAEVTFINDRRTPS